MAEKARYFPPLDELADADWHPPAQEADGVGEATEGSQDKSGTMVLLVEGDNGGKGVFVVNETSVVDGLMAATAISGSKDVIIRQIAEATDFQHDGIGDK